MHAQKHSWDLQSSSEFIYFWPDMDKPRAYVGHQTQPIPSKSTTALIEWREDNVYFILVWFCSWSCLSHTVYLPEDSCMLWATVWHIHVKSHSCIKQTGKLYVRCKSPEFKTIPTQHRCYIKTVKFNVCIHNQIDEQINSRQVKKRKQENTKLIVW
jgi:hypothetical protein